MLRAPPRRLFSTLVCHPLSRAGVEARSLPAFYYQLNAEIQEVIEGPLEELVRYISSVERAVEDKTDFIQYMKEQTKEQKEYLKKLLDAKDVILADAAGRELDLFRQIIGIHAVYSPRVVITSLVGACNPGPSKLSVGNAELKEFINRHVYEIDKGLNESNHNKRQFTAAAAACMDEIRVQDKQAIHQAFDVIFASLSRPHHRIIPNIANYHGVVIGGPHCTVSEKEAYAMVIALGQQEVRNKRTAANQTDVLDPIQDPVGLYDDFSLQQPGNSKKFDLTRQITGGHVVYM